MGGTWPQESVSPGLPAHPSPTQRLSILPAEQVASEARRVTFLATRQPSGLAFLPRTRAAASSSCQEPFRETGRAVAAQPGGGQSASSGKVTHRTANSPQKQPRVRAQREGGLSARALWPAAGRQAESPQGQGRPPAEVGLRCPAALRALTCAAAAAAGAAGPRPPAGIGRRPPNWEAGSAAPFPAAHRKPAPGAAPAQCAPRPCARAASCRGGAVSGSRGCRSGRGGRGGSPSAAATGLRSAPQQDARDQGHSPG